MVQIVQLLPLRFQKIVNIHSHHTNEVITTLDYNNLLYGQLPSKLNIDDNHVLNFL